MASTFTNKKATLDTGATTVYTVPAATTAIVIGCQVGNSSAAPVDIDVWWTDSSDTDAITYLGKTVSLPVKSAYEPISGKLVLEAGDSIKGLSTATASADFSLSVLEIT